MRKKVPPFFADARPPPIGGAAPDRPVHQGHTVNVLPSLLSLQHWYHLRFCGKPPPEDPDQKDSEAGRQQFPRLENAPERNSIGKNHKLSLYPVMLWGPAEFL